MQQDITFGELFKHFRKAYDYTQAEAAKQFGYSEETIKSWEQGRRFPSRDDIKRLASLMEIDQEEVKKAIKVGHSKAEAGKIQLGNTVGDNHISFFENEIHTRWDMYRTGGSKRASRGLDIWLSIQKHAIGEIKGSIWYSKALTTLNLSYQLEGCIYSDLMLHPQAHSAFKNALQVAESLQDHELMAATLARLGVAYIQQNRPKAALSCLNQAVSLIRDVPVPHLKAYIFKGLSEAFAMRKQTNESLYNIDLAEYTLGGRREVFERSVCEVNVISITAQRGINEVLLGHFDTAVALIDDSLKTYNHAYLRGRARLTAQKAEAMYGLKQIRESIDVAEEALLLAQATGSSKTIWRVQNLHTFLTTSRWRKEAGVARLGMLLAT